MAQKFHPDKYKAPDAGKKFSEINSAYEILSDPKDKQQYDQLRPDTEKNTSQNQSQSFHSRSSYQGAQEFQQEIFDEFDDFFFSKISQNSKLRPVKGEDIYLNVGIEFLESLEACEKILSYEKIEICEICKGNKCEPNYHPLKCYTCGGKGNIQIKQKFQVYEEDCNRCEGLGMTIKHPCKSCEGQGAKKKTVNEKITIPRGTKNEQVLYKTGLGNIGKNRGKSGDLVLTVQIKPHKIFSRKDNDLFSNQKISFFTAVLGGKVEVETLHGLIDLKVEAGTQPGEKRKIYNFGIQKGGNPKIRGDHYITYEVEMPKIETQEQKKLFELLKKSES